MHTRKSSYVGIQYKEQQVLYKEKNLKPLRNKEIKRNRNYILVQEDRTS